MKFLKFEDNIINIDEIKMIRIGSFKQIYFYLKDNKEAATITSRSYHTLAEAQEELDKIFKEISEN